MTDPVFHLDAVVRTKDEAEDFDGPLSLILQLLGKNKVEIKDIKISDILAQYLEYLEQMKEMDLEVASEFVEMASHLMYIKARTLLQGMQQVEELETLISSLEQQQRKERLEQMKNAAVYLAQAAARGEGVFVRGPEPLPRQKDYTYSHKPRELIDALIELLGNENEKTITPLLAAAMPSRPVYPIGDKKDEILIMLRDKGPADIRKMLTKCRDRSELAAALMAILELYRNEEIAIEDTEQGMMISMLGGAER